MQNHDHQIRDKEGAKLAQTAPSPEMAGRKTDDLIHDLQVHQIELEMQNEELKRTQNDLEAIKDRFIDLYDFAPVGYFTFSREGLIKEVNLTGAELLGITRKKLINRGFGYFVVPSDLNLWNDHLLLSLLKDGVKQSCELGLKREDGSTTFVRLNSVGIEKMDVTLQVRTAVSDITKSKQAEEKIQASLKEKEILLKEIHHRVKNNMQIISSLLRLASGTITDKKYGDMFQESQNRINSMSLIHEKLYQSRDFTKIELSEYTKDLTVRLFQSLGTNAGTIELNLNIQNVSLGIDIAIPCGLIINELITNSLKHAFPQGRKGEIKISARHNDENMIEIIVSDNGVGIPSDLDFRKTKTLGLHLVTILAQDQLHGKISLDRSRGTEFKIIFYPLQIECQ